MNAAVYEDLAVTVARVSEMLGTHMAEAVATPSLELAMDQSVSPRGLCGGLFHAHLLGACAAIEAAILSGSISQTEAISIVLSAGGHLTETVMEVFSDDLSKTADVGSAS